MEAKILRNYDQGKRGGTGNYINVMARSRPETEAGPAPHSGLAAMKHVLLPPPAG